MQPIGLVNPDCRIYGNFCRFFRPFKRVPLHTRINFGTFPLRDTPLVSMFASRRIIDTLSHLIGPPFTGVYTYGLCKPSVLKYVIPIDRFQRVDECCSLRLLRRDYVTPLDTSTVRRESRCPQAAAMMRGDAVKMHDQCCVWKSCLQPPLYSWSGEDSPRFCGAHASPGMIPPSTVSVVVRRM